MSKRAVLRLKGVDALEQSERAKYETVWNQPSYRTANQGLGLWQRARAIFGTPTSALDIGCGNGRLMAAMLAEGIDAHGVDFAPNAPDAGNAARVTNACLWDMQFDRRFELGVCADVMEHIPPERVDAVLQRIVDCCDVTVFEIANYPSIYGDLHLTLQDADWWQAKLGEFGRAEFLPDASRKGVREYVFRLTANEV